MKGCELDDYWMSHKKECYKTCASANFLNKILKRFNLFANEVFEGEKTHAGHF
jgi:hypothetical protein